MGSSDPCEATILYGKVPLATSVADPVVASSDPQPGGSSSSNGAALQALDAAAFDALIEPRLQNLADDFREHLRKEMGTLIADLEVRLAATAASPTVAVSRSDGVLARSEGAVDAGPTLTQLTQQMNAMEGKVAFSQATLVLVQGDVHFLRSGRMDGGARLDPNGGRGGGGGGALSPGVMGAGAVSAAWDVERRVTALATQVAGMAGAIAELRSASGFALGGTAASPVLASGQARAGGVGGSGGAGGASPGGPRMYGQLTESETGLAILDQVRPCSCAWSWPGALTEEESWQGGLIERPGWRDQYKPGMMDRRGPGRME